MNKLIVKKYIYIFCVYYIMKLYEYSRGKRCWSTNSHPNSQASALGSQNPKQNINVNTSLVYEPRGSADGSPPVAYQPTSE